MRITSLQPAEAATAVNSPSKSKSDAENGQLPLSSSADQAQLGSIASATLLASESRDDRVAELRKQFLSGSYHVDAAKLSAKLVDEHIDRH